MFGFAELDAATVEGVFACVVAVDWFGCVALGLAELAGLLLAVV